MYFTKDDEVADIASHVDEYSDSYARDVTVSELKEVSRTPFLMTSPPQFSYPPFQLLNAMDTITDLPRGQISQIRARWSEKSDQDAGVPADLPGWLFSGQVLYFAKPVESESEEEKEVPPRLRCASATARFAGATVVDDLEDARVTHVVVDDKSGSNGSSSRTDIQALRAKIATRSGAGKKIPHVVSVQWIEESWVEKTLVDEERK